MSAPQPEDAVRVIVRMLTIAEAAERIGVNPKTIRRRIADGSLPAVRIGRNLVRVEALAVEALLRPIDRTA